MKKGGIRGRFERNTGDGDQNVNGHGGQSHDGRGHRGRGRGRRFPGRGHPRDKAQADPVLSAGGHLVAMSGDGTNDRRLAQADVAVAMNTGTQAAREAGNMVDLDSNPTKLIEIVEIGKQLLMTRGA